MKKKSITQIALFILLFTAALSKAQDQQLAPFPATELGQSISISNTDPAWTPLWQVAASSRAQAQMDINSGISPLNKPGCNQDESVCCTTVEFWNQMIQKWVFVTICKVNGVNITPIVIYE